MRSAFCAGKLSDIEPRRLETRSARWKPRVLKPRHVASLHVVSHWSEAIADSRAKFRDRETRIVLNSRLGISVPLEFKSGYFWKRHIKVTRDSPRVSICRIGTCKCSFRILSALLTLYGRNVISWCWCLTDQNSLSLMPQVQLNKLI